MIFHNIVWLVQSSGYPRPGAIQSEDKGMLI